VAPSLYWSSVLEGRDLGVSGATKKDVHISVDLHTFIAVVADLFV
jgi:hypothetical protein